MRDLQVSGNRGPVRERRVVRCHGGPPPLRLQGCAPAFFLALALLSALPAHAQPVIRTYGVATVATLPATGTQPYVVTDGSSSSDCVTGGGSTWVWCRWNGSAWTAFGDGGSGGGAGDVEAVGDCATGSCFQSTTATHAFMAPSGGGVAAFRAITDADVPNGITVDLATLATTATTANAGDSATAFFSSGTIEAARIPAVEGLTTAGASGTAPLSSGSATLAMTDVATQAELDAHEGEDGAHHTYPVDAAGIAEDAVGLAELDDDADTPSAGQVLVVATGDASVEYVAQSTLAAGTAAALAANGANCSAGSYPLGVDAAGAVEGCTADDTGTDDQTAAEVPYTPADGLDWGTDPDDAAEGLDQLALRLTDEEAKADDDVPDAGEVPVSALAPGTDGEIITWDATGAPATVAVGTSGHVLTSNGAGAPPTFQAAAGGSSDIISEGNSSVEVVDAGTGAVTTTVDGLVQLVVAGSGTYGSTFGAVGSVDQTIFQGNIAGRGIVIDHRAYNGGQVTCAGTGCLLTYHASAGSGVAFFPNKSDTDTGLASPTGDQVALVAGGVNALTMIEATTVVARFATNASAPAACSIGDVYLDTSGAFCVCASSNTWENAISTGSCT